LNKRKQQRVWASRRKRMDSSRWPSISVIGFLISIWTIWIYVSRSRFIHSELWHSISIVTPIVLAVVLFLGFHALERRGWIGNSLFMPKQTKALVFILNAILLGYFWLGTAVTLEAVALTVTRFWGTPAQHTYMVKKAVTRSVHRRHARGLELIDAPNWYFAINLSKSVYNRLPEEMEVQLTGVQTPLGFYANGYMPTQLDHRLIVLSGPRR